MSRYSRYFFWMRSTAARQASCGFLPCRISSTTKWLPTVRITASPTPVAQAAPTSLSTYKPAPIMGESPMRPCIFHAMPLVVQAPDNLPLASKASIPMVSWRSELIFGSYLAVFSHSFHAFSASGVSRFCFLNPLDSANSSAPVPASITCGVSSMTRRATEIGCMMCCRNATAPQLSFSSMMHASSVTLPPRSG